MQNLTSIEAAAVDHCANAPMLEQVLDWASVNSGSRNLDGLDRVARRLAAAFAPLPGPLDLRDPVPVEAMGADGALAPVAHGANLHLKVRPEAPLQLLFTGHMDTVFGADHPFQQVFWREPDQVLGGPGVADMKGGLAVMLAALRAVETTPLAGRIGYEVVINSDEEVGSPGSAALIADAARGKRAAFTYEPSALPDGTLAGARPAAAISASRSKAAAPTPVATPRRAATRWSRPPTSRCGWPRRSTMGSRSTRPGSTAAGPTMSFRTWRCCASTCGRRPRPTRPRRRC